VSDIKAPMRGSTNSTAVSAGVIVLGALGVLVIIRKAFGHLSISL
jgi:hypothetical protein